jgi:hypothetical protein
LRKIVLRDGLEVVDPLGTALAFLEKHSAYDSGALSEPSSFDGTDLRRANRGGARISAAEQAAILERRGLIERALRSIAPDASLAARSIPWAELARLFDAFADIRGVGFAKITKALHPKRPALIPLLDSVVQDYLEVDPNAASQERALALVRAYKQELDSNRRALHELQRELAARGYRLSEVRILDLLIWSAYGR